MSEDLKAKVAAVPYWYHRIELPEGVITPGWAPLAPQMYNVPADLTGKRVLDVGAWDGYWTFEALKRGAREVVAIDDFSDNLGVNRGVEHPAWETFDLCRDALGYAENVCKRIEISVYDVTPEKLGLFDVVLFFGTLYHLRYPLLALDKLAAVCSDLIIIESAVADDYSPYRGLGQGYGKQMVMEFYPDNQLGNNPTNWWAPTTDVLGHMVRTAGFSNVRAWKLVPEPTKVPHCRGFASGHKTKA